MHLGGSSCFACSREGHRTLLVLAKGCERPIHSGGGKEVVCYGKAPLSLNLRGDSYGHASLSPFLFSLEGQGGVHRDIPVLKRHPSGVWAPFSKSDVAVCLVMEQ